MAGALGLKVIVEGIETEVQAAYFGKTFIWTQFVSLKTRFIESVPIDAQCLGIGPHLDCGQSFTDKRSRNRNTGSDLREGHGKHFLRSQIFSNDRHD
jgi:hypothetical protein